MSTGSIGPTFTGQGILAEQGLASGLNTSAIISALLQSYEQPIVNLKKEQSTLNSDVTLWTGIQSDLSAFQSAAAALSTPSDFQETTATSSNDAVATGTTLSDATVGSVSFAVDQLAAGQILVSSGSVASTSDEITSAGSLLVSSGTEALGFASLAGSGLSLGAQTIDVTQASAAASTSGTTAVASSVTISSTNDTVDVTANGTAYTLTLASGTYDPSQLAAAVTAAAQAAGAPVTGSLNAQGEMVLATTNQGSAASLQVTGGTALSDLGLAAMSAAASGTDAAVSVDGTSTTLSNLAAGDVVTLAAPTGSISATVGASGGLSVGSVDAENVSTGNGSLASVVSAINGSGAGVTASAVANGAGGYLLELASSATGATANVGIAPGSFSSTIGTLDQAQAAQDAEVSLGGSGGPTISSTTNTIGGLLPGLDVTLSSVASTPVTITVGRDGTAIASKVSALVDAANKVLSDISSNSQYDAATSTGGPLLGNATAEQITQQILSVFSTAAGGSDLGNAAAAGITENKGVLSFDAATFQSEYAAHPNQVEALFSQGGSYSPASSAYTGQVSLVYAGDGTQAGSYSVVIDQSATQATDTGTVAFASGSATVGAADTLAVSSGGTTATYDVTAGQSVSQVASGLDAAFAAANMDLSAQVVSSGGSSYLQITSASYGTAGDFSVTESGTDFGLAGSFTGANVAGTIDNVAASGNGQILSAPTGNPTLAGLSLNVGITGITSATTIGTYDYTPGIAQQLSSLAASLTGPNGAVTTEISGLQARSSAINPEIASQQQIVNEESAMLNKTFDQLEVTLQGLKEQSSALTSAINSSSGSTQSSGG